MTTVMPPGKKRPLANHPYLRRGVVDLLEKIQNQHGESRKTSDRLESQIDRLLASKEGQSQVPAGNPLVQIPHPDLNFVES